MISTLQTLARMDALLTWRRRVVTLGTGLFALILLVVLFTSQPPPAADTSGEPLRLVSTQTLFVLFPLIHIFAVLILPLLLVDSFVRDAHYDMTDLLDSLPFAAHHYLPGKLLAIFIVAAAGMLFLMLLLGILWWIVIFPFDVGTYLFVWFTAIIPIACLNSSLVALFTVGLSTRRQAFLVGLGLVIFTAILLVVGGNPDNPLLFYLNPGRPAMLQYYIEQLTDAEATLTVVDLSLTVGVALMEVVLVAGIQIVRLNRRY